MTKHRRRREVSRTSLRLLRIVFRYSLTRDAYILRIIGRRVGPVLTERAQRTPVAD